MSYEHLKGRRFINLVRCSKDEQADTSPIDQNNILIEFGVERGMIHAGDDKVLAGVSGSIAAARGDIQEIIDRKRDLDDFDVILVQDFSRFTRVGLEHGGALKWELAKEGIEVIFVTFGSTGDPDQDSLIQGVGFYAAQQQGKTTSYNATRGQMSAMRGGNLPHTFTIPFGIDRLYLGTDEKPRHRIRNLPDGTQQKLEVDRDVVIATYGRNPEKGAPVHYHRQSDEKVVLVPGDPQRVEVVRRMYKMNLLEGKGCYLIAKTLNNEGILSSKGKLWNTDAVKSILTNPTYTGVGIAERYATGIYHVRGKSAAPQVVPRTLTSIAQRKKSQTIFRVRDDWRMQPHPHLLNYLDESLRELAIARHEKVFEKQAEKALTPQKKQKPGGDSHGESTYILKDILRSKQGNHMMGGTLCGPPHDRRRYYRLRRGTGSPSEGSVFTGMIPADALEAAVLEVITKVLLDVPNLRKQIERAHRENLSVAESDRNEIAPLLAERDEIKANLEDAFTMGAASRKLIKNKMDQWDARLIVLDERIGQAEATADAPAFNMEAFVAKTAKRLASAAELIAMASPARIRTVLSSLITKLEVDLQTRAVEMELKLPEGVNLRLDKKNPLCTVEPMQLPYANRTQWTYGLKFAEIDCQGTRGAGGQTPCFTCSRRAA
jgi:hypothetical protein